MRSRVKGSGVSPMPPRPYQIPYVCEPHDITPGGGYALGAVVSSGDPRRSATICVGCGQPANLARTSAVRTTSGERFWLTGSPGLARS
jgi:hypothetical protein